MIGFLIKKTFFDLWDNLFRIVPINIGFVALAAIPVFIPSLIPIAPLAMLVMFAGVVLLGVYLAAAAQCLRKVSDYSFFGFRDFFSCFKDFKKTWLTGIVLGVFAALCAIVFTVALPFYLSISSIVGWFLGILLFWFLAAGTVALQFLPAIRARMNNTMRVSLKKCFIVFFDNLGFCVFSFIHNLVILALSAFLAFMAPGPAGILLFLDEGFRLRLLKYDWIDEHPEVLLTGKRPKIPWDELLIEDRENTGTRSFKSFIFPWKD
jgi:hypothetical protein